MINIFKSTPIYQSLSKQIEHYFTSTTPHCTIPILEKEEIIKDFPHNYMNDTVKEGISSGKIEYASTSGTSSEKLMLMRPSGWWNDEFQRGYRYSPTMSDYSMYKHRKACLSTAVCSGNTCFISNPTYEERIIGNSLYLNSQPDPNLWTREDIQRINDEMHFYEAELLEVDPVYLAIFLKKRKQYGIDSELFQPKYITCSYEFLTQAHRDYIKSFYNCPILSLYGSTELGVLFIQDMDGLFYRCPERSIIELIPVNQQKNLYELVVTSWKNEYMPLLRYRTNDVIELAQEITEAIYKYQKFKFMEYETLTIKKLHGRKNDIFHNEKNEIVTIGMLDQEVSRCSFIPWQYQLEINNNKITFRYFFLDSPDCDLNIEENFAFIRAWFPSGIPIEFIEIESFRNERSGKYCLVIRNNLKNS